MPLDPPRIDDSDYLVAYPLLIVWGVLYAVFTPSLFDLPALDWAISISTLVLAACSLVCLGAVLLHEQLTIERVVLWGVLAILGFYTVLNAAAAVYLAATIHNTDRVALVPFTALMVVLMNRRRRWLLKQRRQVSIIAAANLDQGGRP